MMPPRRMPTHLLKLRGSWRAKSRAASEPQPAPGIPPRPAYLDTGAQAEWDRVAPELHALGILARIDMAILAGYCQAYSRLTAAEAGVAEQGLVVRSPNGYPIQNPFLSIANQAAKEMRAFAAELGMSPASRSKVSVSSPPQLGILKRHRETN